jgi:hypothetical protein
MFKITRTSTTPIDPLEVQMNVGPGQQFAATAADPQRGPTFSVIVDDVTAAVFSRDDSLRAHFEVEPLDGSSLDDLEDVDTTTPLDLAAAAREAAESK